MEALERADKAPIEMEGRKLALARLKFEEDRQEQKWALEEGREEKEAADDLELKKMKLTINVTTS